MEQKLATNAQTKNAKLRTPLIKKDNWKTVDSFLLPQNEMKFNEIHKSFSQFPTKFENISEEIKGKLCRKEMNWIFFEHFETQKMFAKNVDEKTKNGWTALQVQCSDRKLCSVLDEKFSID